MAINPFRKGGSDTIPVTEGGTGGTTAPTALSNLGGLDLAAHALINHSGIPGVSSGFTVLETTSTTAQINTALGSNNIVYLKPGSYPVATGTITVPDHKALIGLSGGPQDGTNYGALFSGNQTATFINLGNGSTLSGVAINATGAGTSGLVNAAGGPAWTTIANCVFIGSSWTGIIIDATPAMLDLRNVGVQCVKTGTNPAIDVSHTSGSNVARCPNSLRGVRVEFSGGAGTRIGIKVADGTIFENCYVTAAGSHGFNISEQFRTSSLFGCVATGCGGNGFHHQSTGIWIVVSGCLARSNTGIGFNFPFGGTVIGYLLGNRADTNTGGNYTLGAAYGSSGNI
jgi:hypothetical protein